MNPATLARFMRDTSAATAIEYGLIASLVSVALLVSAQPIGVAASSLYNAIAESMTNAMSNR